jgi:flagellar basal-body rod protein FlgF
MDGIRAGAESLRIMTLRLDTLAANMANASTAAYKKDALAAELAAPGGEALIKTSSYTDLSQGELVKTGNPLDLALEGEGFFAVGEGDGAGFTRDGRFRVDASGRLITASGLAVQGRGGPIILDPSMDAEVAADGSVNQGGRAVDRLKVAGFKDSALLSKGGDGLFRGGEPVDGAAAVRQGFVESSNVKLVEEMASLMRLMRGFESVQKAMTAQDNATGRMISSLGKF